MELDHSLDIMIDSPEVYSPSDDSFLLLKVTNVSPGEHLLEMGCGSGLLSVHAAKAGAVVTAADMNPHAVECTRRNAARNNFRIDVVESDLFDKVKGEFDVIAFNPPYLPEETRSTSWIEKSWTGGTEGNEVVVRFLEDAWRHLAPGGRIYVILSSLGGFTTALKSAKTRYSSELLEERHMFFESIYAYMFKLRASGP
jgi:release factor glutamine methyltransferase